MDSKLIQGLLIGSCILLLFGTIMTVADITSYKGLQAVSAAEPGPSARPSAPAPAEPSEGLPAAEPADVSTESSTPEPTEPAAQPPAVEPAA